MRRLITLALAALVACTGDTPLEPTAQPIGAPEALATTHVVISPAGPDTIVVGDTLHATCNTAPFNPGRPLMLTLHDIIYLESLDFKGTAYQNFGNMYRKWIVPRAVSKSEVIITVSVFEKNTIVNKLGLPEEKVKVIYNAANPKFNNQYTPSADTTIQIKV